MRAPRVVRGPQVLRVTGSTGPSVSGHYSIRLPIPRTELFKKSVYYVGSKLWNDLDENIRDIKDLDDFKKNIKAIYADC